MRHAPLQLEKAKAINAMAACAKTARPKFTSSMRGLGVN
jgi:hypothetical protein